MFDLGLNTTADTHLTDGNDLALVDGNRRLEQHAFLNVADDVQQFIGGRLTGQNVAEIENAIATALDGAEDIDTIVSVDIVEYDRGSNSVVVDALTQSNDVQRLTIGVQ